MMSYEKENGVEQILGSKDVIRHANSMSLIENGEAWMDMIDARNQTSHVYDEETAADRLTTLPTPTIRYYWNYGTKWRSYVRIK